MIFLDWHPYRGYYPYGGYGPFYGRGGLYGYDLVGPLIGEDILGYDVPYNTAFFERNRCTGWEYIR
ncbi:MAG: hypothetical protein JOZ60_14425 [Verrucomicrobia bacterium]|nr:hypothetical protein [Verrucomicrobiota bacterium]